MLSTSRTQLGSARSHQRRVGGVVVPQDVNRFNSWVARSAQQDYARPPPPPPPPPPPREQGLMNSRRSVLSLVAASGAGALVGYLLGKGEVDDLLESEKVIIEDVEGMRGETGFRRAFDGRVFVRERKGGEAELALDPNTPGVVLVRGSDGTVYALGTGLKQVDLADDAIITYIFSDGEWEDGLVRIGEPGSKLDDGTEFDGRMDPISFRNFVLDLVELRIEDP